MSTHTMPALGAIAYDCDALDGKPGHRRICRNHAMVRPEQGGLWLDPGAVLPGGWRAAGGGHLCPDHAQVKDQPLASLIWASTSDQPANLVTRSTR